MTLNDDQRAALERVLINPDSADSLAAAFLIEQQRWEKMAIEAVNTGDDNKAKRCAAFAGSYKSIMSRLLDMSKPKETLDESEK